MIKSLIIGGLALGFLAWIFTACSGSSDSRSSKTNKPRIGVSIPPQIFFVRNIAGDRVDVSCLLSSSSDPETFEPSVNQFRELSEADAYLELGTLPFEKMVVERMRQNRRPLPVYSMNEGIEPLTGTHSHHHDQGNHDHDEQDPHIWSSIKNAKVIALNTLNALVATDSVNEDVYRANYARLAQRIDSIDYLFSKNIASADEPKAFVVWHPSLSYLARDYGMTQIPLVDAGKESSVKSYIGRIEKARNLKGTVFFFQKEFDTERANTIARDAGISLVEINPMNEEWEDEIQKIYDAFTIDRP